MLSGGYGEFIQKVYKACVRPLEGNPPPFLTLGFTSELWPLSLGSGALGLGLRVKDYRVYKGLETRPPPISTGHKNKACINEVLIEFGYMSFFLNS